MWPSNIKPLKPNAYKFLFRQLDYKELHRLKHFKLKVDIRLSRRTLSLVSAKQSQLPPLCTRLDLAAKLSLHLVVHERAVAGLLNSCTLDVAYTAVLWLLPDTTTPSRRCLLNYPWRCPARQEQVSSLPQWLTSALIRATPSECSHLPTPCLATGLAKATRFQTISLIKQWGFTFAHVVVRSISATAYSGRVLCPANLVAHWHTSLKYG